MFLLTSLELFSIYIALNPVSKVDLCGISGKHGKFSVVCEMWEMDPMEDK